MIAARQTLAMVRREAAAFLGAPIAAVVAVLFLVVQGFSFFAVVRVLADPRRPAPYGAVLRTHFGGTFLYWAFLFFVVAALTMRVVAEERRSGTWEVLRTAPVSAAAIVCGKWLGAYVAYLALWIPTLAYVAILWWLAPAEAAPDPGPIVTAYLGVALTGGSALAVGVLASALTRSQIVAATLTFVVLIVLLLVAVLPDITPESFARRPDLARVIAALDVRRHMDDLARGVIDLGHVAVHAGLAFTALVAAAVAVNVERRPRDLGAGAMGVALAAVAAVLLGITAGAVLLGIGAPMLAQMARDWLFPMNDFRSWVYTLAGFFIPLLVVFSGLALFYRLAPRRPTRFSEVWVAALCATVLLLAAETLFVIYLKNFATLNAVYGAFGGIMALLLWIYLSGSIFIFGACLCAAQHDERSALADTIPAHKTKGTEP